MVVLYKSCVRETFRACRIIGMQGTPYSRATLLAKRFALTARLYVNHGLITICSKEQNINIFISISQSNLHCFALIFMRIDNFTVVVQKYFFKMPQISLGIPVLNCLKTQSLHQADDIHLLKMPVIYIFYYFTREFLQGKASKYSCFSKNH